MCKSIKSSRRILSGSKRQLPVVFPSPFLSSISVSRNSNPHKRQRIDPALSSTKSVQFCPRVKLRCMISKSHESSQSEYLSWLSVSELQRMKNRAKKLAKAHYVLHNIQNQGKLPATTMHPTTYEINGESLRGMEHITDLNMGKQRRASKAEAYRSVSEEQCRQRIVKTSMPWSNDPAMSPSAANALKDVCFINASQLSKVYAEKTRSALAYSIRLAKQDAEEAAAILVQDL
ncbi:hypothetical protein HJC23_011095 [Cyclotella cryptica]|uniref:Uncharacterized protein n=1 Tax=Cyclotella cryptica TaxID=29204 RepID=A0ABD3P807_9STRA|eukprot:CCRYP_017307-RA/>CCRYP_017307-RA protein AED:0.18 eAED:0.18 QI:0/-1/0/1/-1/1/1/0/231